MTHGKTHSFEILQHEEVGEHYRRLRAHSPLVAQTAQPGQYMHLLPTAHSFDPLLRRAFSILRCGDDWFEMLYRIEGRGTQLVAQKSVGQTVDALGPLGKPFQAESKRLIIVGGGIGVPPLVFLAEKQCGHVSRETLNVEAFVGARGREDIVEEAALRVACDNVTIATQDGSVGEQGLVTLPLEKRLSALSAGRVRNISRGELVVCACGPWPMLRAVAKLCAAYGVACQVSMEENMPCGIGVCNGCVVPMLDPHDEYGRFQRICVEGPVMDGARIDWGTDAVTAGLADGRAARDNA